MEWMTFCKRTEDPKLTYIESKLTEMHIPHRRNGESWHAPILEVPASLLPRAHDWLAQPFDEEGVSIDDMPDDDPVFHDMVDSGEYYAHDWPGPQEQ